MASLGIAFAILFAGLLSLGLGCSKQPVPSSKTPLLQQGKVFVSYGEGSPRPLSQPLNMLHPCQSYEFSVRFGERRLEDLVGWKNLLEDHSRLAVLDFLSEFPFPGITSDDVLIRRTGRWRIAFCADPGGREKPSSGLFIAKPHVILHG